MREWLISQMQFDNFFHSEIEQSEKQEREQERSDFDIQNEMSIGLFVEDIGNYFRKLFSSKKRRAEDDNSEYTTLRKFRRLESEFPKIIHEPFEDDIGFLKPHMNKFNVARMAAPQRKSFDHRISRRFAQPKITTKRVTNSAYADIEFSDDEDDIILNEDGVRIAAGTYNVATGEFYTKENIRPPKKVVHIPIERRPIPQLLAAKIGEFAGSNVVPNLRPIKKLNPPPPGLLKANEFTNGFHGRGQQLRHRDNSGRFGFSRSPKNSFYTSHNNSIISQENQALDRTSYEALLQQVIPTLYKLPQAGASRQTQHYTTPNNRGRNSISFKPSNRRKSRGYVESADPVILVDEDDDDDDEPQIVSETINLADGDEENKILSAYRKLDRCTYTSPTRETEKKTDALPYVEPVNSLKEQQDLNPLAQETWLTKTKGKWHQRHEENKIQIREAEEEARKREEETATWEKENNDKLRNLQIYEPHFVVIDDFPEPYEEEEEEEEFPELSKADEDLINRSICGGSADQTLCSKFNMNITRRDINSLVGNTWLNDEVINFYMNLLTERGEQRNAEGLPRVYAMNTFFLPRLMQSGHSGVRRWTRKVDIFQYDVLPVPVHVGGVHWCMAIIHLRDKTIKYYDSMGTPNPKILTALEVYLRDESLDKRKKPFDTADFTKESVADCPRQMNGSDCGVFSCMFAEYVSRGKPITFSQQHMTYFRRKMILEIVTGKLLH